MRGVLRFAAAAATSYFAAGGVVAGFAAQVKVRQTFNNPFDRPLEAGEHHVTWDGVADDGTRARTGVFFLRLQTDAGSTSHRILLLR